MNMFDLRADIARVLPEKMSYHGYRRWGVGRDRSTVCDTFRLLFEYAAVLDVVDWAGFSTTILRVLGFLMDYKATVKMGNACQDEVGAGAFSRGKCFPRP